MMQVTFYLPPGVQPHVMQNQLDDWQRDLLVHTTIYNPEMMHFGSPQLPQFKVVLRSFEFSINGLYFVRSALLGFKRSVETNSDDFMRTTKFLMPSESKPNKARPIKPAATVGLQPAAMRGTEPGPSARLWMRLNGTSISSSVRMVRAAEAL